MAKKKPKKNRYNRNSTKRRLTLRPIRHPFRVLAIGIGCVCVVVAAVIWGNVLQNRSEQYRADKEAGRWTVETITDAEVLPQAKDVPDVKAWPLDPGDGLNDFYSNKYSAATVWLCREDGSMPYTSEVAKAAGRACGDRPLSREIQKLHNNDLRAVGVFTVRSLNTSEDGGSAAVSNYLIQTELAILEEYSAMGLDELILVGLPTGNRSAASLSFVTELRSRMPAENAPLLGVGVSLDMMAGAMEGSTLPAEYLRACDYLALDLTDPQQYAAYAVPTDNAGSTEDTDKSADEPAFTSELSRLLYRYRYPYLRYNLRLLFDSSQSEHLEEAVSYGFDRFLVIRPTPSQS